MLAPALGRERSLDGGTGQKQPSIDRSAPEAYLAEPVHDAAADALAAGAVIAPDASLSLSTYGLQASIPSPKATPRDAVRTKNPANI